MRKICAICMRFMGLAHAICIKCIGISGGGLELCGANASLMSEISEIKQSIKRIEKKLDKILAFLEPGKTIMSFNEEDWKTAQWTIDYLGHSIRTLYRNRTDGKIRWIKEGSEPLYYRPDAEKLKNKYMR